MKKYQASQSMLRILVALALVVTPFLTTAGDWPTYLHDEQRTAAGEDETILSPSNAGQLTELWAFTTGGVIASSATVVNNTVYVGSWDGYEYALDAVTGVLRWKTYLGITTAPTCNPQSAGVTSAAAVYNNVVYVGGGDAYWYALDAATGNILWKVYTGDNSASGGHYNWSSPLIYNGYAYIGVASFGDCPLVQGQVLQVKLGTYPAGSVVSPLHTFNLVPTGEVGGGIWTSPTVDSATNTIYVTTGTQSSSDQTLSQAIVALDATTLTLKDSWQIPPAQAVVDSDWGTTPTLITSTLSSTSTANLPLVTANNKNGYIYAYDRSDMSAGPLWQAQIAIGGGCPQCGDGSLSSSAFAQGRLYVAGGNTTIGGTSYSGSVRALNPNTGAYLWQHGAPGTVLQALAYANGLIVDGAGSTVEVLNASTGALLYSYMTGGAIYGSPSISNGRIFVGSMDGNVYAFGLSSSAPTATPTSTPVTAATSTPTATPTSTPAPCPSGWRCADIGAPALAGSQYLSNATWTINGAGADIWDSSDQFHFVWQSLTGNGAISARLSSQTVTDPWAKAGLMYRASTDPAAPNYMVEMTGSNGIYVQVRSVQGTSSTVVTNVAGALPIYLRITRSGSTFTAYTSSNGSTWTAVAGSSVTLSMNKSALAGMAVTSHNRGALSTAIFDKVGHK